MMKENTRLYSLFLCYNLSGGNMKKIFILIMILICITGCTNKTEGTYEIVSEYPHDNTSYTQGLFFYDGMLYESSGLYDISKLYKNVNLETGLASKVKFIDDNLFIEGISILNDKLYALTYEEEKVVIYDTDLKYIKEMDYKRSGWGLTTDGTYLIASDGSDKIYFMDEDLKDIKNISVTYNDDAVININELEYINGYIWANIWKTNTIMVINPKNGKVVRKYDFSDLALKYNNSEYVMNGIAYNKDNNHVYVTGKCWDFIYEIEFDDDII